MGNIVTSTADVLAIAGGGTTLIAAVFGAIRLLRCQSISCCWGGFSLMNRPLKAATQELTVPPGGLIMNHRRSTIGGDIDFLPRSMTQCDDLETMAVQA